MFYRSEYFNEIIINLAIYEAISIIPTLLFLFLWMIDIFFFLFTLHLTKSENCNCMSCGHFDLEFYRLICFQFRYSNTHIFESMKRHCIGPLGMEINTHVCTKLTYRLHVEIGCVFGSIRCHSFDLRGNIFVGVHEMWIAECNRESIVAFGDVKQTSWQTIAYWRAKGRRTKGKKKHEINIELQS